MRISELKAALRANGVTDTATFREKRDLEDALISKLSDAMINSVAAGLPTGVSKEEQLETAQKPSDVPAHLRVPGVEAPTVLGMFAKLAPTNPGPTPATLDAFNEVLSGAPAPAEIRADWPFPADAADPVARLEMIESHLVFKFESPLAAHVWVWKINYQIFAGEGAMMLGTQNMPPEKCGFRITSTLFYLVRYIARPRPRLRGRGVAPDVREQGRPLRARARREGAAPPVVPPDHRPPRGPPHVRDAPRPDAVKAPAGTLLGTTSRCYEPSPPSPSSAPTTPAAPTA